MKMAGITILSGMIPTNSNKLNLEPTNYRLNNPFQFQNPRHGPAIFIDPPLRISNQTENAKIVVNSYFVWDDIV